MTGRPIKPLPPGATPQGEQARWLALYLRRLLDSRETTPEQLAKALAVDRATVYNWLNGKLPQTMVRLLFWTLRVPENGQDLDNLSYEDYWRERAFRAEHHLAQVEKALREYRHPDD